MLDYMATIKRQQRAYRRRLSRFRSLQLTLYNNICALFDRPRASLEGRIRMRTICLTICYTFQRLTQDIHLEIPSATWLNRNPPRVFLTFCHEFKFPREFIRIVPRLSTTLSRWMNAKNSVSCALRVNVNQEEREELLPDPLSILLFTAFCILLHPFEVCMTDYIVFFVLSAGLLAFFQRDTVRIPLLFVTITEWVNTNLFFFLYYTLQIVFYALQNRENDCQGVKDHSHFENSNCESKEGN